MQELQEKNMTVDIAIVGATGVVGECLIEILKERNFPVGALHLLSSKRSAGKKIRFGGKSIIVRDVSDFDFANANIAFFSAGGEVSKKYAPIAAEARCIVID